MKTIRFNLNWNNKLTNECFTAIVPRDDAKYVEGETYKIGLEQIILTTATLIKSKPYVLAKLTDHMCRLDSGFSQAEYHTLLSEKYGHDLQVTDWGKFEFSYLLFHNQSIGILPIDVHHEATDITIRYNVLQPEGQLTMGLNTGTFGTPI